MEDTLTRKAYQHLRLKLARGEFAPGTRLVNRTLAKELGISFTPVREAINQLASEGLVDYVRGGGAYVRRIDRVELAQLYDLRENLEPFAASEAARHITQHELDLLQEVCDDWLELAREMRSNESKRLDASQALRWANNEERFHSILIEAARNRWLTKIASDLLLVAQSFMPLRGQPDILTLRAAAATWRDHSVLLRRLRSRDSDGARQWMLQHIRTGRRYVLEWSKSRENPTAAASS